MKQLPSFLIIGVQRGGTTSLFEYLAEHPRIVKPSRKEIHYFDFYYENGFDWYRGHFPNETSFDTLTYEASPHYFCRSYSAPRIAKEMPFMRKFILLLRNPADRAWSHYCRRRAKFNMTIDDLFDDKYDMLSHGLYAKHMTRWLEHFPRSCFYINKSEKFFADPAAVVAEIHAFLAIEQIALKSRRIHDPLAPRGFACPAMPDAARSRLNAYYAIDSAALRTILGPEYVWDEK